MQDLTTTVGLFAPYGRGEVTELALSLAQLLQHNGFIVKYYCGDSEATGIHRWWDSHVIRKRPWQVSEVYDMDRRVWLMDRPTDALLPLSRREVRVLPRLSEVDPRLISLYSTTVVDDKASKRSIVKSYSAFRGYLRPIPWCGEAPALTPLRPMTGSILCLANSGQLRRDGFTLLSHIHNLLRRVPGSSVTLLPLTASLNRAVQNRAEQLESAMSGRFQLHLRPSPAMRRHLYGAHDLVWLALRPPASAMLLYEAFEHVRPVVLSEGLFFDKLLRHGRNSYTLGREIGESLCELFLTHQWCRLHVDAETLAATAMRRERFTLSWPQLLRREDTHASNAS